MSGRTSPSAKPLDYILQNRQACKEVLEYMANRGGRVGAGEIRKVAREHTPTDEYRNNLLNALYVCACVDKVGSGKDKDYLMTVHGQDLLESFRRHNA